MVRFSNPALVPSILALPAPAIDLVENLLEIDPMRRMSAADALNHAYFQDHNR
jgi:serine/threonine protein kinase